MQLPSIVPQRGQVHKLLSRNEYVINTNKCTIVFWSSLITRYPPRCFGHLCGHLQGDVNKNRINSHKKYLAHSTIVYVWVWVFVCVGFVMCGCFRNMCTCIYCVFVLFRLCIFILICFVCTGVRTTATEWQLNCS